MKRRHVDFEIQEVIQLVREISEYMDLTGADLLEDEDVAVTVIEAAYPTVTECAVIRNGREIVIMMAEGGSSIREIRTRRRTMAGAVAVAVALAV